MADSWEDVDSWEDQDFDLKPVQPAAEGTSTGPTAGQALLAQNSEPDDSKFADEKGIEDVDAWKTAVPPPKEKKKKETKKWEDEETTADEPLDDPLAEKLRQQRLQEEGDLKAAFELFGTEGTKPLDQMVPKTETDFTSYADVMVAHYVKPHKNSRHYKAFVKHICRALLEPLNDKETKEVESCVSQVRSAKVKELQAAQATTKKGKKAQVNVGKGSVTSGLDDMVYDDYDDDGDFM